MPEGFPEGEMAPGAGLGSPLDEMPPAPPAEEPAPEGPDLAAQLEQLQGAFAEQQQILQQLAPVAEYLQAAPAPPGSEQQQESEFDPFDPQPGEQIRRMIREETAPYRELMQERQHEEDLSRARDMVADIQAEKGELLQPKFEEGQKGLSNEDLILQRAIELAPTYVQQYGPGLRSDEAAITQAYEELKAYQDATAAAAEARAQNQAASLAGAPREPGASGVAAQPLVTTQPGGVEAFKARWGLS